MDEQERQKLRRLARLSSADGEYKALCYELLIHYAGSLGREAARQKLDRLVRLYRRQVDEEIERDLRQHEQQLRPAPEPSVSQPPLAAAPTPAEESDRTRAREMLDRATRALNGLWPDGKIPDKKALSGPRLYRKVVDWLTANDPALPFPSLSTVMRAALRRKEQGTRPK